MSKPGPKPIPTALKKLKGGSKTSHRAMPKNEPMPNTYDRRPPPPEQLDRTGQNEWKRVAKDLHDLGLLTKIDRAGLTAYCQNYSQWCKATAALKKHGMLIKAQSGFPTQSPWLSIANRAQEEMRKWLVEFGMTPSSRSRVSAEKPKEKPSRLKAQMERCAQLRKVKG